MPLMHSRKQRLGTVQRAVGSSILLPPADNPLMDGWTCPAGNSPKDILTYLIARQTATYGTSIVQTQPIGYQAHLHLIKGVMKDYSADVIKRAIAYGVYRLNHPFSVRWIRVYARMVTYARDRSQS